jgi:GT2 family glycosyltransferase
MQKIGVVTVAYNSDRVIDGFLTSLLRQTHSDFILYIVDNASSDGTLAKVAAYDDSRIHVLANPENLGAAEGNNQGISAALGAGCDAVLLINNDTEFDPSLLDQLASAIEKHACDMVAPKILFHDNQQTIWSAGGGLSRWKCYAPFLYGHLEVDRGQYDEPRKLENAPTTCLLMRKEVFQRVGLLDSKYFAYWEDVDFCYRANRAGLRIMYLPSARLLHKAHSLTGGLLSDFMMRYTTRNRVYFMLKHFGPWWCLYYVPAYQVYLVLQLMLRKVGWPRFWLREKALVEGLKVWGQSVTRAS